MRFTQRIIGVATIVSCLASLARAECNCPRCRDEGPQCFNHPVEDRWCTDFVRAGCPGNISCFARPSILKHECGYYLGGGARCDVGEVRYCDEGVWGWDYLGTLGLKKVALTWYHGEKYQGGTGAYKTDGPKCECGH